MTKRQQGGAPHRDVVAVAEPEACRKRHRPYANSSTWPSANR